jgi:hypothetical protein
VLALLPLVLLPVVLLPLALVALGWAALRWWPALGRAWWSAPVTVAGRVLGAVGTGFAAVVLVQDVVEIL